MNTDLEIKSPTVGGQGSSRTGTPDRGQVDGTAPGKTRGVATDNGPDVTLRGAHDGTAAARKMSWMRQAACRDYGDGPADWFASETDDHPGPLRAAIRVCGGCPVIEECARYALTNRLDDGVWGGLTGSQRRRVRLGRVA